MKKLSPFQRTMMANEYALLVRRSEDKNLRESERRDFDNRAKTLFSALAFNGYAVDVNGRLAKMKRG